MNIFKKRTVDYPLKKFEKIIQKISVPVSNSFIQEIIRVLKYDKSIKDRKEKLEIAKNELAERVFDRFKNPIVTTCSSSSSSTTSTMSTWSTTSTIDWRSLYGQGTKTAKSKKTN
jgi:hypothetical protein